MGLTEKYYLNKEPEGREEGMVDKSILGEGAWERAHMAGASKVERPSAG